jgi:putative PEP-CTERM system histidine kinase
MTNLIALISYSLAAFVFAGLFFLLLTGWRARFQGRQLLVAVGVSVLWAAAGATQAAMDWAGFQLVWAAEVVRNLVWIFFLLHLLKPFAEGNRLYLQMLAYVRLGCLLLALLMLVILVDIPFLRPMLRAGEMVGEFSLIGQLLFAVLGLALVEQLFRNTPAERRWGIKHLAFGLGAMFAYDFYLYSDALLVHRLDAAIWSARGFVVALAVPLIGLTAARNPDWNISMFVSRRMVLHSTTLFSAGIYMLLMALAGYYIKSFGGEWGGVFQIAFLFGALVVLVALLFSGQLRARIRIFFDKHFFNYRYDYREEWLGVTHLLTEPGDGKPLSERVIWALADMVESTGGWLWLASEKGDYRIAAALMADKDVDQALPGSSSLIEFLC